MNAKDISLDKPFVVLGLAVRTSPASAAQDIPALWQRFLQEGHLDRLPRRKGDSGIYAVYCDYESDYTGPYTMVLGVSVEPESEAPQGARAVTIPRGPYARFLAKGTPAEALWGTWHYVGTQWEKRHERRYVADYERYEIGALAQMAKGHVEADVVVGLAP